MTLGGSPGRKIGSRKHQGGFSVPEKGPQFAKGTDHRLGVAKKTRMVQTDFGCVAANLLPKCRSARRSAAIRRQAVSLRQKPFAIGSVEGEDRPTVAG